MISGIHHFAIIASSEKSVEYYKRLGFEEYFRKERGYDTVVLMEGYGVEIEILISTEHLPKETEPLGLRHIAFKVDDCESIATEFECGPVGLDWIGKKYCFATDPDGNVVEFHE